MPHEVDPSVTYNQARAVCPFLGNLQEEQAKALYDLEMQSMDDIERQIQEAILAAQQGSAESDMQPHNETQLRSSDVFEWSLFGDHSNEQTDTIDLIQASNHVETIALQERQFIHSLQGSHILRRLIDKTESPKEAPVFSTVSADTEPLEIDILPAVVQEMKVVPNPAHTSYAEATIQQTARPNLAVLREAQVVLKDDALDVAALPQAPPRFAFTGSNDTGSNVIDNKHAVETIDDNFEATVDTDDLSTRFNSSTLVLSDADVVSNTPEQTEKVAFQPKLISKVLATPSPVALLARRVKLSISRTKPKSIAMPVALDRSLCFVEPEADMTANMPTTPQTIGRVEASGSIREVIQPITTYESTAVAVNDVKEKIAQIETSLIAQTEMLLDQVVSSIEGIQQNSVDSAAELEHVADELILILHTASDPRTVRRVTKLIESARDQLSGELQKQINTLEHGTHESKHAYKLISKLTTLTNELHNAIILVGRLASRQPLAA